MITAICVASSLLAVSVVLGVSLGSVDIHPSLTVRVILYKLRAVAQRRLGGQHRQ